MTASSICLWAEFFTKSNAVVYTSGSIQQGSSSKVTVVNMEQENLNESM